ncbi:GNAT family N-acetyltransferase [Sphingobacterium paludis]|uniref:Acetyltransferase (GNAT) family protein n=1 Tax=Sphingobacterium paludis TaxID=1476465 RepID=A0A4R7D211_9SPHI|nr:GNAT family N-acetyltransferase [Sphingobacterium paludis]TDS14081.1 acetyltransferase (GNAT) family protein [Sphingobacterium paludis]
MIARLSIDQLDDVVPLFDAYRVFYKAASDMARAHAFLHARLANNESVIFCAYANGIAVGFTQLYPKYSSARTEKNWILNDLYVQESVRKRGVGEALIREAIAFAKQDGAVSVHLSTQVDNLSAQRLYKKIGFQLQDPDTAFYDFKKNDL